MSIGADLKAEGQQRSADAVSSGTRADFLRVITSAVPGTVASVNHYRDLLDAAGIPEIARGGLWNLAVKGGYLTPLSHDDGSPRMEQSTGESAHRAHVRIYRRTSKGAT